MTMTNAQRQARHRLAVKERMARYERALEMIAYGDIRDGLKSALIAKEAIERPKGTRNASNPTQRGS